MHAACQAVVNAHVAAEKVDDDGSSRFGRRIHPMRDVVPGCRTTVSGDIHLHCQAQAAAR